MADRLKNADKVGIKAPPGFSEGADFTRDGKNLKAGDLVLINRYNVHASIDVTLLAFILF